MKRFVLFSIIFVFSACAGNKDALRDRQLNRLSGENKALQQRIEKLEKDVLMQQISIRMQDRMTTLLSKHLKFVYSKFNDIGMALFQMGAGYAQLDKDIDVLWEKVLRFHHKLKKKNEKRHPDKGVELKEVK